MLNALDYALRIGGALLVAGAVYGGIRADLRGLHVRLEALHRSTRRVHKRLDKHIGEGGCSVQKK